MQQPHRKATPIVLKRIITTGLTLPVLAAGAVAVAAPANAAEKEVRHVTTYDCSVPGGVATTTVLSRTYVFAADGFTHINRAWKELRSSTKGAPGVCAGIDPANPAQQGWVDVHGRDSYCLNGATVPAAITGSILPDEEVRINDFPVERKADGTLKTGRLEKGVLVVNITSPNRWYVGGTFKVNNDGNVC